MSVSWDLVATIVVALVAFELLARVEAWLKQRLKARQP